MEAKTKEEALEFARLLMTEYQRHDRDIGSISKSLYSLAKKWRLSYSFEDFTVDGVPCTQVAEAASASWERKKE